jgi:hypothetical protein
MYRPVLYEAIRTNTTVRNGKKRKATLQYVTRELSRRKQISNAQLSNFKLCSLETDGRFVLLCMVQT